MNAEGLVGVKGGARCLGVFGDELEIADGGDVLDLVGVEVVLPYDRALLLRLLTCV